ncbi:hypothetical protein DF036_06795 [Burkholderia contaminans]|nr:hypothetical protein DF036_06795 [Burkholderia contaminans]
MNEEAKTRLRCRPGDMARIVRSSNRALIGRTVEVARLHRDGRWECVLVGDAVMGLADDGLGLLLTRDWLFPDGCLEPKCVGRKNYLAAFTKSLAT